MVVGVVPRDNDVQASERRQRTVVEHLPESPQADVYRMLARAIEENGRLTVPTPLSRERLRDLVLAVGE